MKTTIKEFEAKREEKRNLYYQSEQALDNENFKLHTELKRKHTDLQKEYFDKLEKVKVSFSIGCRSYYQEVTKIGNALFCSGRKMTKGRGFYNVEIIPEITQEMKEEMVSDSYYY